MYCAVMGDPVEHSRSPEMYAAFCREFDLSLRYERIHATKEVFSDKLNEFIEAGGHSVNITLPLKIDALSLASRASDWAKKAGSVNMLTWRDDQWYADNFDGLGLLHDLQHNAGFCIENRRILILGAGGATRGAIPALLSANPESLTVANRTIKNLKPLAQAFESIAVCGFDDLNEKSFDLLINATSSSIQKMDLALPVSLFHQNLLCYDMFYTATGETYFLNSCAKKGVIHCRDGLGMLLEQGALAFESWFGVRANTKALIENRSFLNVQA